MLRVSSGPSGFKLTLRSSAGPSGLLHLLSARNAFTGLRPTYRKHMIIARRIFCFSQRSVSGTSQTNKHPWIPYPPTSIRDRLLS